MRAHFCSFLRKMKGSTAEAGGPPPIHKDLELEDNETLCKVPLFGLLGPLHSMPLLGVKPATSRLRAVAPAPTAKPLQGSPKFATLRAA